MKSLFLIGLGILSSASAKTLYVGDPAPLFKTKTHKNEDFDLAARKGTWTVLYFYPKADTPGCTKQACAFRDSIEEIRGLNAEVFGVSADSVADQEAFVKKHRLNFTLLADADLKIINLYGTKMPLMSISKRWTFLINPELKVAFIDQNVDPIKDAGKMAEKIRELSK